MSTVVTPERNQGRNSCATMLEHGYCYCPCQAAFSQQCGACNMPINIGDCITHRLNGWGHTECPIGNSSDRGIRSIEDGFVNKVQYGRLENGDCSEQSSLPVRRRLEFDESEVDSAPRLQVGSKRQIRHVTQESEDEQDFDHKCDVKRARYNERDDPHCNDAKQLAIVGQYADQKRTDEQMRILQHEPKLGELTPVNALAGCGKTTTIALLCNKIAIEDPGKTCLYLVFNKKISDEVMQSNKLPVDNEVRTTHSYVLRHYFGKEYMWRVDPKGDYDLDQIIENLQLHRECQAIFKDTLPGGRKGERVMERRVKTIAGFVRKTIKNFEASSARVVQENHVFWRANQSLSTRTAWRKEVKIAKYVRWAEQFFRLVEEKCCLIRNGEYGRSDIDITHDGYLKVAQLAQLRIPHDYIFIDEAQDMTSCQADLFWGQRQRDGKKVYLFGDVYQQLYSFRGASDSFRKAVDKSRHVFSLTGSFRFGKNIASYATAVLASLGGETLSGRSNDDGRVNEASTISSGVVLCRTNNGIFRYLFDSTPSKWCYLDRKFKSLSGLKASNWQLDLESFLQDHLLVASTGTEANNSETDSCDDDACGTATFTYKNIEFRTIHDIQVYVEEEGDIDLSKSLALLTFLVQKGKSIVQFYDELRSSFSPMKEGETPNDYDGVIMATVHKAKGLEFGKVLISNDFNFKAIISAAAVNETRHCDEANILYVAITRAISKLYLTPDVMDCISYLTRLDHVEAVKAVKSLASCREIYSAWKDEWTSFKQSTRIITSTDDVPYPPDWRDTLALHPKMSIKEQSDILLSFLLAYHPDKFMDHFGNRIQSEVLQVSLKEILGDVTRKCVEMLNCIREEGTD